jgi:hypothetical protein
LNDVEDVGFAGDVGRYGQPSDLPCDLRRGFGIKVRDYDARAFKSEPLGESLPDSVRTSCDNHDLVFEFHLFLSRLLPLASSTSLDSRRLAKQLLSSVTPTERRGVSCGLSQCTDAHSYFLNSSFAIASR